MFRIKMLHNHESHIATGGNFFQNVDTGFKTTGGRAYAYNWKTHADLFHLMLIRRMMARLDVVFNKSKEFLHVAGFVNYTYRCATGRNTVHSG